MTPEEKAERLIIQFIKELQFNCQPSITKMVAKQCAAICVQEKIDFVNSMPLQNATRAWRKEMQDELQSVLTSIQNSK